MLMTNFDFAMFAVQHMRHELDLPDWMTSESTASVDGVTSTRSPSLSAPISMGAVGPTAVRLSELLLFCSQAVAAGRSLPPSTSPIEPPLSTSPLAAQVSRDAFVFHRILAVPVMASLAASVLNWNTTCYHYHMVWTCFVVGLAVAWFLAFSPFSIFHPTDVVSRHGQHW